MAYDCFSDYGYILIGDFVAATFQYKGFRFGYRALRSLARGYRNYRVFTAVYQEHGQSQFACIKPRINIRFDHGMVESTLDVYSASDLDCDAI